MTPFDDFWTASAYSALHQRRLGERLREFRPDQATTDPFELPSAPLALGKPGDRLQRLFRARRSTREFSSEPMSARQFGAVLAALADEDGRAYPSAGGFQPLRCYAFLRNVTHELNGRVVRYDARRHAVQDIGPSPDWPRLREVLAADAEPALVLVLLLADEPVLAKYGQRGGRFGLIEAGAAAQSVCLRMAQQRLGGYLLGGAADGDVLALLGMRDQPVRLAAVIACGRTFTRR
ncbi:hypothetical protein ALI22I_18995 [Saccharothrix sp. ALI-22-I]|uniref:nitroreductase family protein n=1 Tax=Saccharothrix sp. ALI-22-I TaxID=1933778 RepID=UPI00097C3C83|nr:nitroreductase family protein [Saccharothrix sp. ALI-22-I]ONI88446.1 hypothetical protein ALI22I_18995 [Saccharothrix sp. ALI-22-I]